MHSPNSEDTEGVQSLSPHPLLYSQPTNITSFSCILSEIMYTHMPLLLSLKESETLVYEVKVPSSYWYPINGNITLPFRKQFGKSFWLVDN